jgi:hypothetical protein
MGRNKFVKGVAIFLAILMLMSVFAVLMNVFFR